MESTLFLSTQIQIEMLFHTEQQLPRWLRRHVQFEEHVEYPNKKAPLKTRVIISFFQGINIDEMRLGGLVVNALDLCWG